MLAMCVCVCVCVYLPRDGQFSAGHRSHAAGKEVLSRGVRLRNKGSGVLLEVGDYLCVCVCVCVFRYTSSKCVCVCVGGWVCVSVCNYFLMLRVGGWVPVCVCV